MRLLLGDGQTLSARLLDLGEEVDALVQRTNQSTGGALTATHEEAKPLDANSILDMLKRDVGV